MYSVRQLDVSYDPDKHVIVLEQGDQRDDTYEQIVISPDQVELLVKHMRWFADAENHET